MQPNAMHDVHQLFSQSAPHYDSAIVKLIPYYTDMLAALVNAIIIDPAQPISIMDLGSGTGNLTLALRHRFPNATIHCLDLTREMQEKARQKLCDCTNIIFETGNFETYNFHTQYDVIVSSLALHHLTTDADKLTFCQKIYDALKPGGCFYNADVVLGANDRLQQMYLDTWHTFVRANNTPEHAEKCVSDYDATDHPARLMDHLTWMQICGFQAVDVIWKYYDFAVFGGWK